MASARCKSSGPVLSEYGFTSVRGRTFEDCLQPVETPTLALVNKLVES
jgi:hypothetical protein